MSDTIEEIRSVQAKEKTSILKEAEALQSLTKHPGWPMYLALLESVGQNYYKTAMLPLENALESVKSEFAKGALTGLSLAAGLPASKIRQAQELSSPATDNKE